MHRYRIGYTRTTGAQDHPEEVLGASGCHEIVSETAAPRQDRPQLRSAVDRMTVGDVLVVTRPSQLAPDVHALLALLAGELAPRGIALQILSGVSAGLHEPHGTPAEQGLFATAALVMEMESDLRSERTHEGLAAARAHGRAGGRPRALTDEQLAAAQARRARGQSIPAIARELGVGRSTLYRALEPDSLIAAAASPVEAVGVGVDQDHVPLSPAPAAAAEPVTASPDTAPPRADQDFTAPVDEPLPLQGEAQGEPPLASPRLRVVSRLGSDWATDDNDVLWWRRETRAGSVSPAWPGSGWTARNVQHALITTGAGKRGAYTSRIKALTAVAADFEARRRARTPHADVTLDGAPGWRLRQTQADHDRHRWNVVTPTGDVAGTVTKAGWHHQAWEATAGDPAKRHHIPVEPIGDEPGRSSADGYWRTRNAAALAVARWHDPDLDTGPAVRR